MYRKILLVSLLGCSGVQIKAMEKQKTENPVMQSKLALCVNSNIPIDVQNNILKELVLYNSLIFTWLPSKIKIKTPYQMLECYGDFITSRAVFNRAGDKIVTADKDGMIKIWDVKTGRCLVELQGHNDWVNSAVFNNAGDKIVSASSDGMVKIWDVKTGRCLAVLQGHNARVNSAVFNNTGDKVMTRGGDGTAIWNVETGKRVATLEGHNDWFNSAVFNNAGDKIVTTSDDGTTIWNVETGKCIVQINNESADLAIFNNAGDKIFIVSEDGSAEIWNLKENCFATLHIDTQVESIAFNRAGDKVVTAYYLENMRYHEKIEKVKIWDVKTGRCLVTLQGHNNSTRVLSAVFNNAGDKVMTRVEGREIRVWDVKTGKCLLTLKCPNLTSTAVFNETEDKIVVTMLDEGVIIWDIKALLTFEKELKALTLEQVIAIDCAIKADLCRHEDDWFYEILYYLQVFKGLPSGMIKKYLYKETFFDCFG